MKKTLRLIFTAVEVFTFKSHDHRIAAFFAGKTNQPTPNLKDTIMIKLICAVMALVVGISTPAIAQVELFPFFTGGATELHMDISTRVFYAPEAETYYLTYSSLPVYTAAVTRPGTASITRYEATAINGPLSFVANYTVWSSSLLTIGGIPHGRPSQMEGKGELFYRFFSAGNTDASLIVGGLSDHGVDSYTGSFVASYAGVNFQATDNYHSLCFAWREMIEARYSDMYLYGGRMDTYAAPRRFLKMEAANLIITGLNLWDRWIVEYRSPSWNIDYAFVWSKGQIVGAIGWRQEYQSNYPTAPERGLYAELGAGF